MAQRERLNGAGTDDTSHNHGNDRAHHEFRLQHAHGSDTNAALGGAVRSAEVCQQHARISSASLLRQFIVPPQVQGREGVAGAEQEGEREHALAKTSANAAPMYPKKYGADDPSSKSDSIFLPFFLVRPTLSATTATGEGEGEGGRVGGWGRGGVGGRTARQQRGVSGERRESGVVRGALRRSATTQPPATRPQREQGGEEEGEKKQKVALGGVEAYVLNAEGLQGRGGG